MSYAAEMVDDLRARLNDPTDSIVTFANKMRFLNRGQAAMFPKVYRMVRDNTLVLADNVWEYDFPAGIGTGKVLSVECESGDATGRYIPLQRYDVLASLSTPVLMITDLVLPSEVGSRLRIVTADRLTPFVAANYTAAQSEVYSGPVGTEELPVLYAMGCAASRGLDARLDYTRYSTTQSANSVDEQGVMQTSQFWFAQFELLLDRLQMPFPVARN